MPLDDTARPGLGDHVATRDNEGGRIVGRLIHSDELTGACVIAYLDVQAIREELVDHVKSAYVLADCAFSMLIRQWRCPIQSVRKLGDGWLRRQ